jgi:alkylation response protein AidB-like acyl-CoA dehydrogenase
MIGTFQALQHKIADAVLSLELSRSLLQASITAFIHESPDLTAEVAASRLCSSAMYVSSMEAAIQSHGGYGFTWEQGIHFAYRRALFSRSVASFPEDNRYVVAQMLGLVS